MPETKDHDAGTGGQRGDVPKGQLLSAVLSHPVRRSALRHLLSCECATLDELAGELGLAVKKVRYHVGILREHSLATRTGDPRREGEPSCFAATCKEESEVIRRLAETVVSDKQALRERRLAGVPVVE